MKLYVFAMNYDPVMEKDETYLTEFKIPAASYNEAVLRLKLLIGSEMAKKCFLNEEREY
jgi:hypothetical protein